MTLSRFTTNGWHAAEATDMMTVYNSLPAADIQRPVLSLCVVKFSPILNARFCLLAFQTVTNCSNMMVM